MSRPREALPGLPAIVTMPSFTVTVNLSGSAPNSPRITSSRICSRISSSGRSKTDSTSVRVMIPTRWPAASVTGTRLTPRAYISQAACSTESSGVTVTAGWVIRSAAVMPYAFS